MEPILTMSISPNVVRRAKTFNHLFRMENRCEFNAAQWAAAMESFRRLSKTARRQEVLAQGERLSKRLVVHLPVANPVVVGEAALTFGQLGLRDPEVIHACKKLDLSKGRLGDLTNYIWGVSLLQMEGSGQYFKVARLVENIVLKECFISGDDSRRLHISSLVGRVHVDHDILGPATRKAVNKGLEVMADQITNPSRLQKEVTAYVAEIAPPDWEMEVEYFLQGYHLDIAFPEQKIAVEVDGPYHYYPDSDEPVAKDLLKDYVLKRLGWKVIHISYKDWSSGNVDLNFF